MQDPASRLHPVFLHGRIAKALVPLGIERWLVHRGNVAWTAIASGAELLVVLLFFHVIYLPDSRLHELWPWGRQLWLIGSANLLNSIYRFLFKGLKTFGKLVERGELDVLLSQPNHPVVRIALSQVDPSALLSGIYSLPILLVAWKHSPPLSAPSVAAYLIYIAIGVLIRHSLTLAVGLFSLRLVRVDAVHYVVDSLMPFARYPLESFSRGPWVLLKYVLPVVLLGNVPLLALFGELSVLMGLYPVVFLGGMHLVNSWLWRTGARLYASGGG